MSAILINRGAAAYFNAFLGRFPVRMKPLGFTPGMTTPFFEFEPDMPCSHARNLGFNLDSACMPFTLTYNPQSIEGPTTQMHTACWNAMLKGPLKDVEFFASPLPGEIERHFLALESDEYTVAAIRFNVTSSIWVTGLCLDCNFRASSWESFIPAGTPEHALILAALKLARAQFLNVEDHAIEPLRTAFAQAHAQVTFDRAVA